MGLTSRRELAPGLRAGVTQWVELAGEFMSMGAPAPKDGFRQLAAIVQAPGRNVFFRLVGPDATVEANRADFTKLIEGLMPAD